MNRYGRIVALGGSILALAGVSACQTLTRMAVGEAVEAVTGEEVRFADTEAQDWDSGPSLPAARPASTGASTSVYQVGPTPGWETGFRAQATVGSEYYQNQLCLNLPLNIDVSGLWSRELSSPFLSGDPARLPLFIEENNQGIDPGYTSFGEVRLGGASPPTGMMWQSANSFGIVNSQGVSCPFLGLVSFGRPIQLPMVLR